MMLFGVLATQHVQLQAQNFWVGGDVTRFVMQCKYPEIEHHERLPWQVD